MCTIATGSVVPENRSFTLVATDQMSPADMPQGRYLGWSVSRVHAVTSMGTSKRGAQ